MPRRFIGNPVLGDNKYGNDDINKQYGQKKQLLISKQIMDQLKEMVYILIKLTIRKHNWAQIHSFVIIYLIANHRFRA